MLVIKTREELAAARVQLPTLRPTAQAALEILDQLTATLDETTNTETTAALVQLRQAVEELNQSNLSFNQAGALLTAYGSAL